MMGRYSSHYSNGGPHVLEIPERIDDLWLDADILKKVRKGFFGLKSCLGVMESRNRIVIKGR